MSEIGIADFPHLGTLERRLKQAFQECDDYDMEIDEIIIFGSYGRGTATKGVSDLDVFLYIEPETLNRNENLYEAVSCMEGGDMERKVLDGFGDWFAGLDVDFSTDEFGQWKVLYKMATHDDFGVYSLTDRQPLFQEEIQRRKEVEDVRGRLDLMDKHDVEGPRRKRLEEQLERLKRLI